MNTVRIREEVKEMRKAGAISSRLSSLWLHAPLFIHPNMEAFHWPDYRQWYDENLSNPRSIFPKKYPFDSFIILEQDVQGVTYCATAKGQFEFIRAYNYRQTGPTSRLRCWAYSLLNDTDKEFNLRLHVNGKPVNWRILYKEKNSDNEDVLKLLSTDGLNCAIRLCIAVLSRTSTVLRVAPDDRNNPRSSEWKLARTHYVVLSQKQAQLCSKQRRGPTDREVTLAAHWRRAHFRRLVAIKYSEAKRGKLIPVRQAWVGPTEWYGLDDKIYKVVGLNDSQHAVSV